MFRYSCKIGVENGQRTQKTGTGNKRSLNTRRDSEDTARQGVAALSDYGLLEPKTHAREIQKIPSTKMIFFQCKVGLHEDCAEELQGLPGDFFHCECSCHAHTPEPVEDEERTLQ